MKLLTEWWSWTVAAVLLTVLGLRGMHIVHYWLMIAAFFGSAILVVVVVCRQHFRAQRDDNGSAE